MAEETTYVLGLLFLLFTKHLIVDFYLQTMDMVKGKGIYMNRHGLWHSGQHALGTFVCVFVAAFTLTPSGWLLNPALLIMFPILDFMLHYHIDWAKMNINKNRGYTPSDPQFWHWLGVDQYAHALTYLLIAFLAFYGHISF